MKQCQSCGMPLNKEENKGTDYDGTLSEKYCHYCYKNGEFVAPNATLEEFKAETKKAMQDHGVNRFIIWMTMMQIPRLERWRNNK